MNNSPDLLTVRIPDPEHMNLMGLLMRGLLESSLIDPRVNAGARKLHGDVRIVAGTMVVILRFTGDEILLVCDEDKKPRATVRGDMKSLLEVVAGEKLLRPVLTRKVRASGNLLMLLRILPLIRAPKSA